MKINRTDCIVVHGCPSDSSEEKTKEYAKHWIPWIKKELISRGIKTEIPLMPEPWHPNYEAFKKVIKVVKATDQETVETIKKVFAQYDYLLDPHTAVAWHGAEQAGADDYLKVILSTASPVKFADLIRQKAGLKVDDEQAIRELKKIKKRKIEIANDYKQFKNVLLSLPL